MTTSATEVDRLARIVVSECRQLHGVDLRNVYSGILERHRSAVQFIADQERSSQSITQAMVKIAIRAAWLEQQQEEEL